MFRDLSINLAASVIYDFGKAVLNAADKTETVQLTRKKLGVTTQLNDFPDRYLEALVELRFEKKSKVVLDFFRSEDIMKTFYNYYYGSPDQRKNDNAHTAALDKHIEALQVGDAVKAENVDVALEVNYFWTIFKQKVHESRTVREVEIDQQLGELKTSTQNTETLLQQLNDWLRQRETENIELEGYVFPIGNATIQKALTQKALTQNADKIFNIGHIETAQFISYGEQNNPRLTPAPLLNVHLCKVLITAIRPHNPRADRFLTWAEKNANWETNTQASDKAKEILAYSFVGVIGIQLSKLFAIGNENFSETTQNKYIEKCIQIAKRSIDLVIFALISQIWESQKTTPRIFSADQNEALQDFFDRPIEPDISGLARFFQTLFELFIEHRLSFPFPQLQDFGPYFQPDSAFQKSIGQLQALNARVDQKSCSSADCTAAEQALTEVLTALHFLAACRMASIKRIGYWQIRTAKPKFLHRYTALGIDSKANVDAEKVNFTPDTAPTYSVLLHRGDAYQESLNLSPFIIDFNALTNESGAKICFFRASALADDSLDFTFLEDNSSVNLSWKGVLADLEKANELLLFPENRRTYNLDCVIEQFQEARKGILGASFNFDDL